MINFVFLFKNDKEQNVFDPTKGCNKKKNRIIEI